MCVVSMIMDHFNDKWNNPPYKPWIEPNPQPWPWPLPQPYITPKPKIPGILSDEEISEFRKLLERARKYDKEHHEPNCELESKKEKLKKLAKELGVDISFEVEKPHGA